MGERNLTGRELDLSPVVFSVPLIISETSDLIRYIIAQPEENKPREISANTLVTQNIDYGIPFLGQDYISLHNVPIRSGEVKLQGNFTQRNPLATMSFSLNGGYDPLERYVFHNLSFDIGLRDAREVREEDVELARQVRKYTEMFFIAKGIKSG